MFPSSWVNPWMRWSEYGVEFPRHAKLWYPACANARATSDPTCQSLTSMLVAPWYWLSVAAMTVGMPSSSRVSVVSGIHSVMRALGLSSLMMAFSSLMGRRMLRILKSCCLLTKGMSEGVRRRRNTSVMMMATCFPMVVSLVRGLRKSTELIRNMRFIVCVIWVCFDEI